jgi:hypothetical protein
MDADTASLEWQENWLLTEAARNGLKDTPKII